MKFLDYLRTASQYKTANRSAFASTVKINLITNFTDGVLRNILTGVCMENGIYPEIHNAPYKQYHFDLKNNHSELYTRNPDITFIFFDVNPFKDSEFREKEHFNDVLADIERYAGAVGGTVIVNSFVAPYQGAYGNLFEHDPLFGLVQEYNRELKGLSERLPNVVVFDTDRIVHRIGENNAFDLRGTYAFDMPFTSEFATAVAEEWFAYLRAARGGTKKCIVLDLDNTLWGGVVGELGPNGIALGPDYPGNAFVNFQRALLAFRDRGVILAIASKNNAEDVAEAFQTNPSMILKEEHFSAIRTNWSEKEDQLKEIAKELNIGTDSLVFIDDDPVNRERIRLALPEVSVPEFSLPPEEYVKALYSLDLFHQLSLTEEDRQKGKMYADEHKRKQVMEGARSIDDYIKELDIVIRVSVNEVSLLPRVAQLTSKTNQFNLTTRRYTEGDIERLMTRGAMVFSANVTDRFGDYGTVIEAIVVPDAEDAKGKSAKLDIFLMSCRVMGRGIECRFVDHVIRELHKRGFRKLEAEFIPSAKNKPAESFLKDHGFSKVAEKNGTERYNLDIARYLEKPCPKVNKAVTIIS